MIVRLLFWAAALHVASACWCCGAPTCGCGCGGGGGGWGYVPPQIIGYNRYPIYIRTPAAEPVVKERVVTVIRDEPQPRVRVVHQPAPIYVHQAPAADSYSVGPASYQSVPSPQAYQTVQSPPSYQAVPSPQAYQPVQSPPLPPHSSYQAVQSPAVSSYGSDAGVQQISAAQDFSSFKGYVLKRVTI
ncbi:hypothetical protein QR680_004402 [Steinernema hermaphroditum]|uniref:Uncharacterized protein n=1 Tax=Steinernema hermaphroditum TaxID=289476 RepID=A0AA39LTX6_9BILA|nr:hypothetical protein QR680_004402 [Steinernema hermaphroditum]